VSPGRKVEARVNIVSLLAEVPGGACARQLDQTIAALNQRIGLPAGLGAMGVPKDVVPTMVKGALADHSTATNPRPLKAEDFERLFSEAW
jgi:4-hydroxybutyrate dehydrogenase